MHLLAGFIFFLFATSLRADDTLIFKKEWTASVHWVPYAVVLAVLVIVLLLLASRSKKIIRANAQCKIIEKIAIHHKTRIYVIAYQDQQFLIADNQNSLAIHALNKGYSEDE